jgi:hypothetical protein
LVEHVPSKYGVAGSNPVYRSISIFRVFIVMKAPLREELNKMRGLMKLNEDFIKVEDGDYSNVRIDSDSSDDKINQALLDDLETAAKNAGVYVTITSAIYGHSENTTSGNRSRHPDGNAVDISIIDGIGSGGATNEKNGNSDFREKGNRFTDQLEKMGYIRNTESGNKKAFLWQTNTEGNHFNHIHVSNTSSESSQPGKDKESEYNFFGERKPRTDITNILKTVKQKGLGKIMKGTSLGKAAKMLGLGESVEEPKSKMIEFIKFYQPRKKEENTEE